MSKPYLYKKKPSPFYYAGWYDPIDGKQIAPKSTGQTVKAKAMVIANQMYDNWLINRNQRAKIKRKLKVSEAFKMYSRYKEDIGQKMKPTTFDNYKQATKNLIASVGDMDVKDLTNREYLSYLNYMTVEKNYSTNTKSIYTAKLRALFNFCVEHEFMGRNTFKKVSEERKDVKILTKEQIDIIFAEAKVFKDGVFYNGFYIALLLALRVSEICSLKWSNVYDDHVLITGKGNKTARIPFSKSVKEFFDSLERGSSDDKVVPGLFPRVTYAFFKVIHEKHGIKASSHDLRRYRLSQLSDYLSPKELQIFARHSSFSTTYAYYVNKEVQNIAVNVCKADFDLP